MEKQPQSNNKMIMTTIVLIILVLLVVGNIIVTLFSLRQDPEVRRALDSYATQLEKIKHDQGKLPESIIGEKGAKGDTGIQGPKGDKGDKGDTGNNGLDGYSGVSGNDGEKGEQGEPGPAGRELDIPRCNPNTLYWEFRYVGDTNYQPSNGRCVPGETNEQ